MRTVAAEQATPEDLRKYGLSDSTLSIMLNDGTAQTEVRFGAAADDTTVYATNTSSPLVVTVEKSVADMLRRPPEEYRRRDVFTFRAFTANRVEFVRGDQNIVLERTPGTEPGASDAWRRVSPSAGSVDRTQMDSLLTSLADMRVTEFLANTADTGLDAPVLTITAAYDDAGTAGTETVTFGRQGPNTYASRSDEPGALRVDGAEIDEALKALDALVQ
jgi:hypothetical protein